MEFMESTLLKLALQIPDLIVLFLIVKMFLGAMKDRDMLLKELHEEHVASRTESRMVISRCVEVMGETVEAIHNVSDSVKQCSMRK
jgi:hypothetical protein